jgi:hypothetical protein
MFMRSSAPRSFYLSFMLPRGVDAVGDDVALEGCKVRVSPPLVKICGPSRERVFQVATAFLRHACRDRPPLSIAATLRSPAPLSGSDSWSIIVGADVAFSPTSLDPHFPKAATGQRSALPGA